MFFIPAIRDIYDANISTPPPAIPIELPEILDAYFAKKIVEKEFEESTEVYTVVSGDSLSKIAKLHSSTVAKIKADNSLKSDVIKVGQKLNITKQKEKGKRVSFEYVNSAKVEQEIYLVVETEHFKDKEIQIDIHQGKEKVIAEKDKLVEVLQDGDVKLIRTKVGEWATNEDIENKDEFKDWAIAKVQLKPKTDESLKKWEDAIHKTEDKRAYLYLLVDAHSHNTDYDSEQIVYYGNKKDEANSEHSNITNYWLDVADRWFALRYCDCGKKYDKQFQCTRYGKVYGPVYWGTQKLADYKHWDGLIKNKKLTQEEKEILVGMSENEGKLDSVQSYDSEILTVGAMQKTINPKGEGEFTTQVQEFKNSNPDKYKELFEECGWTVESGKMYYKDPDDPKATKITGSALKTKIRKGFVASQFKKKLKCKPLEPITKAATDKDFQAKQVEDFIKRLNKVLLIKPTGHSYQLKAYVKSKLGKATVLDHHINRPAYVDNDFGKALNNFFVGKDKEIETFNKGKEKKDQKAKVSRNPADWGTNHATYEKTILDDYGKNRRGTDMEKRYKKMVNKF